MPEATQQAVPICPAADVLEGGLGVRFPITADGHQTTGFVVRFNGVAKAYVNRCAHVPIELDWNAGEFFDSSGLYLMCSTHGAVYDPASGHCLGGPCRGKRLQPIKVYEQEQTLFWQPDTQVGHAVQESPKIDA